MKNIVHPAKILAEIMTRIYEKGLTTTSGGNLSIRDANGDVWITPGNIDKGTLTAEDMVCIHPDGTMDGKYKPSREYPFHIRIYEIRPDVNAIVHAHPADLVAFSIADTVPDIMLYPESYEVCGSLGRVIYANPGTDELRDYVEDAFSKGCNAAVMMNHGEITSGTTMEEAYRRFESLAYLAKVQIAAARIGNVQPLTKEALCIFQQTYGRTEEQSEIARIDRVLENTKQNVGISTEENRISVDICKWTMRAYQHGLVNALSGMFAERVDATHYCMTPLYKDNDKITEKEIVNLTLQDRNSYEKQTKEKSEVSEVLEDLEASQDLDNTRDNGYTRFLGRIFQKQPEIGGIILANPVHFTGFALTDKNVDSSIIMESYVLLRDIPRIQFAEFAENPEQVADQLNEATPVVMIENYGIVSIGKTLQEAFDRMEVAENNARTYGEAGLLGTIQLLEQKRMDELDEEYHLTTTRR